MSTAMPEIVREHLLTIEWGQAYPDYLLELQPAERKILDLQKQGARLVDIHQDGSSYENLAARSLAARGKQEAKAGLNGSILDLPSLAQRVVLLNSILADRWQRAGSVVVVRSRPGVVLAGAKCLDERFGQKWKACPRACTLPVETLNDCIDTYDDRLGPQWRQVPSLLSTSPPEIIPRITTYDQHFGQAWRIRLRMLLNDPVTVLSSMRALKTINITQENTSAAAYFALLSTTVANKRKKAVHIRRNILGHTQVYMYEGKKHSGDIGKERRGQTDNDRQKEAEEIEELTQFIHHLGAAGFTKSIDTIDDWARGHGYLDQNGL